MRGVLPVLATLLFSACNDPPVPSPELLSVAPAQASSDAPVPVTIKGAHLLAQVVTDFNHHGKSALDATFIATLSPHGGDPSQAVTLTSVALASETSLTANVPAGLARGEYDLTVVDPAKRSATLAGAYRVVASAETVAGFRIDPIGAQRARIPFTLSLAAVDDVGRVVDGFTGTVTLADRGGTLSPSSAGPFALGRAHVLVTVASPIALDAVTVQDPLGHLSTSEDFAVQTGLPASLAFVSLPQTLTAGQCSQPFEIEVQDVFGQPAQAEAPLSLDLGAGPQDAVQFFSDAACATTSASMTVAAGETRASAFFFATRVGSPTLRVASPALPSATQVQTVTCGPPTQLSFQTPGQALAAGACSLPVRVQALDAWGNPSPVAADLALGLTATPAAGVALFADEGCTSPLGAAVVAAGSAAATFYFKGTSSGTVRLDATATLSSGSQTTSQDETIGP